MWVRGYQCRHLGCPYTGTSDLDLQTHMTNECMLRQTINATCPDGGDDGDDGDDGDADGGDDGDADDEPVILQNEDVILGHVGRFTSIAQTAWKNFLVDMMPEIEDLNRPTPSTDSYYVLGLRIENQTSLQDCTHPVLSLERDCYHSFCMSF